jgi:hypothetical protein
MSRSRHTEAEIAALKQVKAGRKTEGARPKKLVADLSLDKDGLQPELRQGALVRAAMANKQRRNQAQFNPHWTVVVLPTKVVMLYEGRA